jgi:hypothetical protein
VAQRGAAGLAEPRLFFAQPTLSGVMIRKSWHASAHRLMNAGLVRERCADDRLVRPHVEPGYGGSSFDSAATGGLDPIARGMAS